MTWQYGRQLATAQKGSTVVTYEYDVDGIRERKTVGNRTYDYVTLDGQVIRETIDAGSSAAVVVDYMYDNSGAPYKITVSAGNAVYTGYYILNQQCDVIAIINTNGSKLVDYTYNAWGAVQTSGSYNGIAGSALHTYNALKYRGYYHDNETGFYYLQTRYYDPEIGRYINSDSVDVISLNSYVFNDKNLYAYCDNNPIIRIDCGGAFWDTILDIGFLSWSIYDVIKDPFDWKNWAALGIDAIFTAIPFIPSGVGQLISYGNKIDEIVDIVNGLNKITDLTKISNLTMIGRNMNRVVDTAKMIGVSDNLYKVWTGYDKAMSSAKKLIASTNKIVATAGKTYAAVTNAISAAHNGLWLAGKLRTGFTVIDIGVSTAHVSRGLWYGTERAVLSAWKTRNIWKVPINFAL